MANDEDDTMVDTPEFGRIFAWEKRDFDAVHNILAHTSLPMFAVVRLPDWTYMDVRTGTRFKTLQAWSVPLGGREKRRKKYDCRRDMCPPPFGKVSKEGR